MLAPLAIGSSLMIMVHMGGHVSGAHYNPAVSVAMLMRGKLDATSFLGYVVAQIAGAVLAAVTVFGIVGQTFAPAPSPTTSILAALLVEVLYTFALALVVLNVATSARTTGNSFYGLAIGFTVVAAAVAGGPISGGAFNPAVGIGPTLVHATLGGATGALGSLWLYIVGPCIGGAAAAVVFGIQEAPAEAEIRARHAKAA
jgi:aquaporin Z